MILDSTDKRVLGRLLLKRSIDFAAAALNARNGGVKEKLWLDYLARQTDGIQALAAIGDNRLEDVDRLVRSIDSNLVAPPPSMMEEYLARITDEEREDEARLLYIIELIDPFIPMLEQAEEMSFDGPTSDLTLKDSDSRLCMMARSIFNALLERCDGQDEEVLGDSVQYIRTMNSLCDAIIAIRSGRTLPIERLSDIIDSLNAVDQTDFDSLFYDVLSVPEMQVLDAFRLQTFRYAVVLCASIILSCKDPMYTKVGCSPPF